MLSKVMQIKILNIYLKILMKKTNMNEYLCHIKNIIKENNIPHQYKSFSKICISNVTVEIIFI